MKILVINGPNLNMLGRREPNVYGSQTLDDINKELAAFAAARKCKAEFFQSNCEGAIIDKVQSAACDAIIINAGAYSHYSYAIHDALKARNLPAVEVHMTNIYTREGFRHESVLSMAVRGVICGFGADSYKLAVEALTMGEKV